MSQQQLAKTTQKELRMMWIVMVMRQMIQTIKETRIPLFLTGAGLRAHRTLARKISLRIKFKLHWTICGYQKVEAIRFQHVLGKLVIWSLYFYVETLG